MKYAIADRFSEQVRVATVQAWIADGKPTGDLCGGRNWDKADPMGMLLSFSGRTTRSDTTSNLDVVLSMRDAMGHPFSSCCQLTREGKIVVEEVKEFRQAWQRCEITDLAEALGIADHFENASDFVTNLVSTRVMTSVG